MVKVIAGSIVSPAASSVWEHLGGLNLFRRGFGNYDQNLVLRLFFS